MPERKTPSGVIFNSDALERERWMNSGEVMSSESLGLYGGRQIYGGSSISNSSADFVGDWRSVDAWQRLDLFMVRARSRQLERGNDMCKAYKRNMINNVLGHKGFHRKVQVVSRRMFGDATDGVPDEYANDLIRAGLEKQGRPENLTTRKRLSAREVDALILSRLIFDGEFITMKRPGFANDCQFAWQLINADYLDHNLNRLEDGRDHNGAQVARPGNMTRMGVELDAVDKFPVAYWFLQKRPNETQYNYNETAQQRYIRVPADQVIHEFMQTEDEEQTRGFPWIFAAMIDLYRAGKFKEAALINATIGASKGLVYEKQYPEGFIANGGSIEELDKKDGGYLVDKIQPSSGYELPYGVTAKQVDYRFPDAAVGPFLQAMNMGTALAFGTSYATTTGDLSNANFVSSKLGLREEQEQYMAIQEFLIAKWKLPAAEEELYRGMLSRTIPLPLSKIAKFDAFTFVGRRWSSMQPVDDLTAYVLALDNNLTSLSDILEATTGESRDDMLDRIEDDNKAMAARGLARVHGTYQFVLSPGQNPAAQPGATITAPPMPSNPPAQTAPTP